MCAIDRVALGNSGIGDVTRAPQLTSLLLNFLLFIDTFYYRGYLFFSLASTILFWIKELHILCHVECEPKNGNSPFTASRVK
jgi:hypothetical protein